MARVVISKQVTNDLRIVAHVEDGTLQNELDAAGLT